MPLDPNMRLDALWCTISEEGVRLAGHPYTCKTCAQGGDCYVADFPPGRLPRPVTIHEARDIWRQAADAVEAHMGGLDKERGELTAILITMEMAQVAADRLARWGTA